MPPNSVNVNQQLNIIQPQINHTAHMQQPVVVNQNYQMTQQQNYQTNFNNNQVS